MSKTNLAFLFIYLVKMVTGASIGKQYAKTDELGVPFAVTVDSTTSVTIRERDSKQGSSSC
jgi:glycyl-tRNA synthetase (class II)